MSVATSLAKSLLLENGAVLSCVKQNGKRKENTLPNILF